MTNGTTDIYELIDLALFLDPEGEGLDFTERNWSVEKMIEIKNRLGQMRTAIDTVGLALAERFTKVIPIGYSTMIDGGLVARVSTSTRVPRWQDDTGQRFAAWLVETQTVEQVATMLSITEKESGKRRPRLAALSKEAKDTFIRWDDEDTRHPILAVGPVEQIATKWIQDLQPGDVARWDPDSRSVEYLEGGPDSCLLCQEDVVHSGSHYYGGGPNGGN